MSYYAWQRLKKNKLAIVGLVFVVFSTLIAVLGALIRPDSTPMANEMLLQLTTREPGFSSKVILIRKNKPSERVYFYQKMFFGGEENDYTIIPINKFWFDKEDVVVEKFDDSGLKGQEIRFNVADAIYPIDLAETVF